MEKIKKHKFSFLSIAYWFLLLYIVSALVLWYFELEKQNKQMYLFRYELLKKDDVLYNEKLDALNDAKQRKTWQYAGEGITFLVLILVGAAYVYRVIRRQIKTADQQQNFMMAVTHELKTPIAISRLNLETLQKRKLQPEQQQKLLTNTLSETQRLNDLTTNILITAQLEGGKYAMAKDEINLSELAESCLRNFSLRYHNTKFISDVEENIWVKGEQLLLEMLINNLLDNALKYSPYDGSVSIRLFTKTKNAVLEIADEGIGIDDNDKKKVFEKFYRVGNESVRKTKGTGLGLFLCKKIVKDHKGSIDVCDNQPNGSIFTVKIPLLE
ncbi:two-component sensor histidine kinase [Arachidicoccus ginsenosidimutans]|uniref:sensor histidine kinase n=1 Tax=Arachidicoccus sp. BS20 TaxID=1850526 RepID=UPI0007F0C405|nr:ATP-binding protein [Arachidicoccus sp. BS20]ANI90561.1 two-component sensor histidine kinase [Arachidicoccus sp. BS20]